MEVVPAFFTRKYHQLDIHTSGTTATAVKIKRQNQGVFL